jgi:hypothetical protein
MRTGNKLPADRKKGICYTCGKPTQRPPNALYCWTCQNKAKMRNELRSAERQRIKNREKAKLKEVSK